MREKSIGKFQLRRLEHTQVSAISKAVCLQNLTCNEASICNINTPIFETGVKEGRERLTHPASEIEHPLARMRCFRVTKQPYYHGFIRILASAARGDPAEHGFPSFAIDRDRLGCGRCRPGS